MTDFKPQSFRILVVDDSETALHMVKTSLQQAGFQVMIASSGEDALELMAGEGLPNLALVDINMPGGMDGFEFAGKVLQFSDLPIIMLTAVDETDMIIDAIEKYAEDYMTKPVGAGELIARVRRVLRRIGEFAYPLTSKTRVDDDLSVDFVGCEVVVKGEVVSLTPTETKLLYILMRSAGQLITTNFLLRRLWPKDIDTANEERLRVYIHRLRHKIEQEATKPYYVKSLRGKGYFFVAAKQDSSTK
jgi:DNA-binding response OmpR family regulator